MYLKSLLPRRSDILPLQILFLDDEQDICDLFVDLFASENICITTFTESPVALAALGAQTYDLVFLDYRLKGPTGIEVAHQMDPQIPKILLSGDINLAPDKDILKIIKKPFNIEEVEGLISYFAASKRSQRGKE